MNDRSGNSRTCNRAELEMRVEQSVLVDHEAKQQPNALVVTNSMVTGIVVASTIERAGIRSRKSHPDQALTEITKNKPDMIATDCSCNDVLRFLQDSGDLRPYCVLLSVQRDNTEWEGLVDGVVVKPVTVEALHSALQDFLKNRKLKTGSGAVLSARKD